MQGNEARYRSLVENQFELISRSDPDGRLTFVNDAYGRTFGRSCDELIGQEYTFNVLPAYLPVLRAAEQALRNPPYRAHFETCNLTPQGPRCFEWEASAILSDHGEVIEFQGVGRDVTDKVRAITQLRESEAFRKRVFERSPLPIVIMDSQTYAFIECNEAAVAVYRYASAEQLIGKTLRDVSAPLQYDGVASVGKLLDYLERAKAEGQITFEWRHQRPDGECWDADVHLLSFQSGERSFIQGTLQDTTARRSMELAIRERVKELTCLFRIGRLLEDHHATTDTICNSIVAELTVAMQHPQAAIPSLFLDGVQYAAGGYREELSHALSATIEVGQAQRGQLRVFYAGNESFIIPEEQNLLDNITRMLGLWLEQREAETARVGAQRELEELNRELEQRVEERTAEVQHKEVTYRALFENSNDAIFLMAPSGEDLLYNQRALDLLGYTREEYATLAVGEIIVPEQRAQAYALLAAALSGKEVPLYERTLIGKNHRLVDVEINLSPVRDTAGNVIMVQSVVRDITERKKAQAEMRANQEQLRLVNDALEKASRLKDEFLASMSHELRTPLTGVLGLAESLQMEVYGALNERQLNALKNIENSGRHLLELINDILDLSKIEAGKLDLEIAPCAATDICRASLQLMKGLAGQKRIQVSFAINDDALVVTADARRLKQMIVNLLSNAVKFTPERGRVGLAVAADAEAQQVRFTVWDNGIGIQPEQLPRLFRPFVQLDSSLARQYTGTGLGLALVQRMADLHNGRVEVESIPGEGSRFTIILPWSPFTMSSQIDELGADVKTPPHPVLTPDEEATGPLVLIADDNKMTGEMITDFLTAYGFRVDVVTNGYALLERAHQMHPDVVLVDIQMPGLDGLEVIRRLRAHHDDAVATMIILAVTALAMSGDRERCLAAGANEYVAKPIVLSDLAAHIEALTSTNRKSR
ncbi:MAG: PAS domain S-box protein [Anaerolineales bacterium]|nr:PAS domain S-box protein [Anaerolineales bacterium]